MIRLKKKPDHGQAAVDFVRSLRHPRSRLPEQAFQLDPWQEDVVRRIYGPRHPDGSRVVKTAVILVPRGARKTTLGAALALLHAHGPAASPHGEVVPAAADGNQANIAYDEATAMLDLDDRQRTWQ